MTSKLVAAHTAPVDNPVSDLVDWLELKVLESEFNAFNLNELASLNEDSEDEENEDFSEQDLMNEEKIIEAAQEIETRIKALKEAYPFELSNGDKQIRLKKDESNIGRWIYLYCLFISHRKPNGVNVNEFELSNQDRDLLQIASVYAAVGHFDEAVSFGWPRPDSTNFMAALENTFKSMGEGVVRDHFLPGVSPYANDGEIDLVAWQPMNDGMPGKLYMLGQVATGSNWKDKSILSAIDYIHRTYFMAYPPSPVIGAMFIPFCIDGEYGGSKRDVIENLTQQFGIIYYRLRLPYYALLGTKKDTFPRADEQPKLKAFIKSFLGDESFENAFAA